MSLPIHQEKYKQIQQKLNEAQELHTLLSKDCARAKKKIRILTFEKNLLLDSIARLYQNIKQEEDVYQHDSQQKRRDPQLTTVASAPPKRSKINHTNTKPRRVQPIQKDEHGHPTLPQQIGVLTVLSLGNIITDRDTFHNERYIFPVGYTVQRTYPSMIHPNSLTIITSTILDGGDGPRFHVVAADQPDEPIIANSATGAWTVVVRRSNEIRHRDHSNSASGPDYYGFKHPTIAKMIQDLPNARRLKYYIWQTFEEMEPRAAKGVMAAAEKKRDHLEHMGNMHRKDDIMPRTLSDEDELDTSE
ncbi:F/Y rich C-terminus-domain-containing protein [Gilbertella persicaria]|uniref:F/Y rich C-terminus-domain-containing protein n=1 Tax=Gilbertella persicaria TaxID=101096 RepID=UPI0022202B60|nr:F/Y rich C-terminus-domain-containing protein [Gilbertella persicaria]KAI8084402.1 F/Y rich C-terminus-domain-containing protein [Gilbertella persicaria]